MCLERESRKGEEPKTTSVPYVHRTTITTTTIIKKKKTEKRLSKQKVRRILFRFGVFKTEN